MCFFEDPQKGSKVSFVQFPLRYDGVDPHDRYNNHNTAYYDIYLKGLDGLQGPTFAGNGCVFRRVVRASETPANLANRSKCSHTELNMFKLLASGAGMCIPRVYWYYPSSLHMEKSARGWGSKS